MNQMQEIASSFSAGASASAKEGADAESSEATGVPGLVLYSDWWDAVRLLSKEQKAAVLEGLFALLRTDVPSPRFNKQGAGCFVFLRNRVLRDMERFRARRRSKREANKQGAAFRSAQAAKEQEAQMSRDAYEQAFRRAVMDEMAQTQGRKHRKGTV